MRIRLQKLELIDETSIDAMSREELATLAKLWRQKLGEYQSIIFRVKKRIFGRQSEKTKRDKVADDRPKPRGATTKRPSERYPDAKVREEKIGFTEAQKCDVCGTTMQPTAMAETSEYLDVDVKEFTVVEQKRQKCRCPKCHGSIVTAPLPPRVTPGGSYSDGLIVDATVSKYCDLIPMERYCQMAGRGGLSGLPPHSLIQASFRLAEFLQPVFQLIKQEALNTTVLLADETPHRMLEGDAKQRWFLWGFSSRTACVFECHDTRSGDVATEILRASSCLFLLSDAYSGYKKSIALANVERAKEGRPLITPAYCNAHARREYSPDGETEGECLDAKYAREQYEQIYKINKEAKGLSDAEVLAKRQTMTPYFDAIRDDALKKIDSYPAKSAMGKAYAYFLKYFEGLTVFLTNAHVPIDNNASERLLRSSVVGRKTWYGTHSREGAATAAVHFTIVETCKINSVNPRAYYLDAVDRIHGGQDLLTPSQFKAERNTC